MEREVLAGGREVDVMLYHHGTYPRGAIAPVKLMWRAKRVHDSERSAWLWVHPAAAAEALATLCEIAEGTAVSVADLSGQLLRFELRGPRSQAIAHAVFSPVEQVRGSGSMWRCLEGARPGAGLAPGQGLMVHSHDPRLILPLPHHRLKSDQGKDLRGESEASDR